MILDGPDLAAQIRGRGQRDDYVRLERRIRPPEAGNADEAQLAGEGLLIQLDGLHLADAIPLAAEYRLVSLAAVSSIADADPDDGPPGPWLLQHIYWTEAETRISALAATPALAIGKAAGRERGWQQGLMPGCRVSRQQKHIKIQ